MTAVMSSIYYQDINAVVLAIVKMTLLGCCRVWEWGLSYIDFHHRDKSVDIDILIDSSTYEM